GRRAGERVVAPTRLNMLVFNMIWRFRCRFSRGGRAVWGTTVPRCRADRPVPVAAAPDGAPSGDRRRNDAVPLPHGLAPSRHRTGPPASSGGRAARLPSAPTLVIERHVSRWVSPNRWERARAGARARAGVPTRPHPLGW